MAGEELPWRFHELGGKLFKAESMTSCINRINTCRTFLHKALLFPNHCICHNCERVTRIKNRAPLMRSQWVTGCHAVEGPPAGIHSIAVVYVTDANMASKDRASPTSWCC